MAAPDRRGTLLATLVLCVPLLGCDAAKEAFRRDDRCGPEIRTATVRGSVGPAQQPYAISDVTLTEPRDDSLAASIRLDLVAWNAPRSVLEGHVTGAVLLSPGGDTLTVFPVAVGPGTHVVTDRRVAVSDRARVALLRRALLRRDVSLALATDLPGEENLRSPMPYGGGTEYMRELCPKERELAVGLRPVVWRNAE